jgi:uncharacterized membrane protein YbhN (UPF0104 family)
MHNDRPHPTRDHTSSVANPLTVPTPPSQRLKKPVVAGIALAVLVLTALALFGDLSELSSALSTFDWRLAVPILLLTFWNYVWRWVKWELYLSQLAVGPIDRLTSVLVFFSAFSMSLTPGKVGELIKSVYLRRYTGAPVNRTSAIVAAERLTDALAMLLLATFGIVQFKYGRPLIALLAIAIVSGILLLRNPAFAARLLSRTRGRAIVGGFVDHGLAFLDASGALYRSRVMAFAVGLGLVSWAGECFAFFLVLRGLGIGGGWHLLLTATFVLAVSSLAGGASMLPGGLGVADASMAGMLLILVESPEMTRATAAAATILIRFATLWFAVVLGAIAVAWLERRGGTGPVQGQPST